MPTTQQVPEASLLIFLAVSAEEKALRTACKLRKISFRKRSHDLLGEYFELGPVGHERVLAVRTTMGPIGYEGSASKAKLFQVRTGAQAILSLGIAFGVSPANQSIGDVLVSTSIFPYDSRDVVPLHGLATVHELAERFPSYLRGADKMVSGYKIRYDKTPRHPVREELLGVFLRNRAKASGFKVHFGTILSGASRIHSGCFRRELIDQIPSHEHRVVGGEMESVGILVTSRDDSPTTVVCKGISDFADHNRDAVIKESRARAALNAAVFALDALIAG